MSWKNKVKMTCLRKKLPEIMAKEHAVRTQNRLSYLADISVLLISNERTVDIPWVVIIKRDMRRVFFS